MKKAIALGLALVMSTALLFTGCSSSTPAPSPEAPAAEEPAAETLAVQEAPAADGEISILIPGATHGWPVGVLYYANEKQKELETLGQKAVVYTADTAQAQIEKLEDLMTRSDIKGVMILPFDNSVVNAVKGMEGKVPFVMFDRILEGVNSNANVMGDNFGIGYETAKIFLEKGLQKTDKILEMPGDNSSVPEMRSNGFREGLKTQGGWTDEELNAAIFKTDFTGWSRDNSKTLFEGFVGSKTQEELDQYKFIFTHDDEIAIGIFNAIQAGNLGKNIDKVEVLAASAGNQEMYNILNDGTYADQFYLFSLTYPPYMVQDAIDVLVQVLNGETVDKEIVIPVKKVDSTNAKDYLNPDSPY